MSSQSAVGYAVARGTEHLAASGAFFLVVSFCLNVGVANTHEGGAGAAAVSWCENTAFWLGIVFIAGDLIGRVIRRARPESGGGS
jgi:hypothetical protein